MFMTFLISITHPHLYSHDRCEGPYVQDGCHPFSPQNNEVQEHWEGGYSSSDALWKMAKITIL